MKGFCAIITARLFNDNLRRGLVEAISLEGRRIRNELERVSTVNSYYLGYEFDETGTEQLFGLMAAADESELSVDKATFWSQYIHAHVKEGATLVLGPIVVPSAAGDVVDGVRRILSGRSVEFEEESNEGIVDFVIRETHRPSNEDIYELMYLLQQEYRNSGILVSLFVYVSNDQT